VERARDYRDTLPRNLTSVRYPPTWTDEEVAAYAASETAALLKQIGSSENKASKFQDRALAAEAGNERLQAQLLEAQGQIPHEGDGSCDHCGKIPSIAIPTSLCNECRDGVKRAETAEAQLAHMRQLLLQTMADEGSYDLADWKADVEEALLSTTSSAKWLEKHNAEKDAQLGQMRDALVRRGSHFANCPKFTNEKAVCECPMKVLDDTA
jgi:hypothetical protein